MSPAPAKIGPREKEVICRTILTSCGVSGIDYSLNPYIGCLHACAYCYARYMREYSGHSEPWGTFVDIKVNAPRVLLRQLRRLHPASIFMSSVTDPYQPPERRYELTRRILDILSPLPHAVRIHTKSSLVERDIPILRRFRDVSVTFTIVTGDESAARFLERGASPVRDRIMTLQRLAGEGIRTSVFIGPIIPFVTEIEIGKLLIRLSRAGVKKIILDDLHYMERIGSRLLPALRAYRRDIPGRYRRIPQDYYQQIAEIVLKFCRKNGIRCYRVF